MSFPFNFSDKLYCLKMALYFFGKHFVVVLGLGLVAALGRVVQLGGFGPVASWMNLLLEITVEASRVLLFLYVLGLADVKSGFLRIRRFFASNAHRKLLWNTTLQNVEKQWGVLLLNILGILLIAMALNFLIDWLAYETALLVNLKANGILTATSTEWVLLLFFKNLTVIPLMIVFETLFVLWVTDKLAVMNR